MAKATDFSLADFHYTNNPDVLSPPEDFEEWINDPEVQQAFSFTGQSLLMAPKANTEILSNLDGKRRKIINMTSYNYLGLSTHPEVLAAAKEAADKYGLSSSGAPLVSGTLDLHLEFAEKLAKLKHKEAALIFSSGYGGNVGALQGMMRKGDVLIFDEKIHKSLIDGGTLSHAKMEFFDHNDMNSLEQKLEKHKDKRKLIVAEGVYSMDGDMAKLPEMVPLSEAYNAPIYLDEAHSTLMFGEKGGGVGEHFGLEDKIGMSYGTLSKSFGGVGGFIASNERIIRYLKGYASSWNFSCAPSPPVIAGLIKALEVATRDSTLRDQLWANTRYLKENIQALGLDIGDCESQVIPVIIGQSGEKLFHFAGEMQKRGLFLQPIDYPAVPAHARRFRISVSSQFTREDMDTALNIMEDVIVKGMK
ncbi:aminotransferase class I/II-fold pyridoxal phosphate-dependent enzyme [Salinispira pacifica]|uniref:2-amino-3-ketobutyrate coenzyme A ligase n=1 Tax=Salinispira pacifica TaxID=1307761 RepID=V5WDF6_9SPIO|nr:aminotransferase class I/II-fold pyridoxal phosphate-dependent enzyme [Salinispira pacifica]AHC13853.1 2-amino-3-ketobutyrate coenzyme A ligase [Salinispira pacifica]